jgi:hypothetical protein
MKKPYILTILLILTITLLVQCKKENYSKKITGTWYHISSGGYFNVNYYYYTFYNDGTYQFIHVDPGSVYNFEGKKCSVSIDEAQRAEFIERNHVDPISERLPFTINDDILIMQCHEEMLDITSPIVIDTFKIEELKNCAWNNGKLLTLKPFNESTAKRSGITIDENLNFSYIVYRTTFRKCDPCGCD